MNFTAAHCCGGELGSIEVVMAWTFFSLVCVAFPLTVLIMACYSLFFCFSEGFKSVRDWYKTRKQTTLPETNEYVTV